MCGFELLLADPKIFMVVVDDARQHSSSKRDCGLFSTEEASEDQRREGAEGREETYKVHST